jgi:hypothetical protein
MSESLSPQALAASFQGLMSAFGTQGAEAAYFYKLLKEHFAQELDGLTILGQEFEPADHANVHLALEAWLQVPNRTHTAHGLTGGHMTSGLTMSTLASANPSPHDPLAPGPVEYLSPPLGDGTELSCFQRVLFTVSSDGEPCAVLFRGLNEMGYPRKLHLEVMSKSHEAVQTILTELRLLMRERNIHRGRTLTLSVDRHDGLQVNFHTLPALDKANLILPATVLERLERQTEGFSRHRDWLLKAGRHLRRGILLYGPPGTAKP